MSFVFGVKNEALIRLRSHMLLVTQLFWLVVSVSEKTKQLVVPIALESMIVGFGVVCQ